MGDRGSKSISTIFKLLNLVVIVKEQRVDGSSVLSSIL